MNHRLYRDLRRMRRNASRLSDREQTLIRGFLMRPEAQGGGGLNDTQADEAVAALVALGEKMAAEGRSLTAKVIVERAGQVAAIYRQQAAPAPAAPAPTPAPVAAPVAAPPAPVVEAAPAPPPEPTAEEAAAGLTSADLAFIERYYKHFTGEGSVRMVVNPPPTASAKAATLQVLRAARPKMASLTMFPWVVEKVPQYLGKITLREPVMPQPRDYRLQQQPSQGFRLDGQGAYITFQIPTGWTWGDDWSADSNASVYATLAMRAGHPDLHDSKIRRLAQVLEVSARGVQELPKQSVWWTIEATRLSPEGERRARSSAAEGGSKPMYRLSNDQSYALKTKKGDAYGMAYSEFRIKKEDHTDSALRQIALHMERAGLYALAATIRIAFAGQYMEVPKDDLLYKLNRAPRIEDKTVTGPQGFPTAGMTVTIPGLGRRSVSGALLDRATDAEKAEANRLQPPKSFRKSDGKGGYYYPFDYQRVGIAYLLRNNGVGLVGDEMGLGKTIQALGFLSVRKHPDTGQPSLPALIVCPGSVVTNWRDEINAWLPDLRVSIFGGKGHKDEVHDVMIASWDALGLYPERFQTGFYQTFIGDEAHYVKNLYKSGSSSARTKITVAQLLGKAPIPKGIQSPYTRRTQAFLLTIQQIPNRILLTGTPVSNGRMTEWWSLLNGMDPSDYPELPGFINEYRPTQAEIEEAQQEGTDPYARLIEATGNLMVRRVKQDVADQTRVGFLRVDGQPPVQFGADKILREQTLDLSPDQEEYLATLDAMFQDVVRKRKFDQRVDNAVQGILAGGDPYSVIEQVNELEFPEEASGLAEITYKRQYIGELKVPNAICWIEEKLAEGEPVVVWAYHKNVIAAVAEVLKRYNMKYAIVDGNVSPAMKGQYVKDFQEGRIDVIVGSVSLAEGVTLTRARYALFIEYWWQPGKLTQAQDRIFRVGQKRNVFITTLHAPGTIDDRIEEGVREKMVRIDMMTGLDYFQQENDQMVLCPAAEPAMKVILDRLNDEAQEGAIVALDEISLDDVERVLADDPRNVTYTYRLSDAYMDPESLQYRVSLRMGPAQAEARIRATPKATYTKIRDAIIQWLATQPNQTASRVALEAAMKKQKISTSNVANNIKALSEWGVTTYFDEDPAISWRATKVRKAVDEFRRAGGVVEADEVSRLVPSATKQIIADLVAKGVLSSEKRQIIETLRNNPRRRPGQMVVNGRLADLPLTPEEAVDLPRHPPGSPEDLRDRQNREQIKRRVLSVIRNAKRDKRWNLPPLGARARILANAAKAIVRLERKRKIPRDALVEHAVEAYMDLRDAVEAHKDAHVTVKPKYLTLLRESYDVLSPYES
jgi:hypothetical protein